MSHPVSKQEVGDVLSSIRRLVESDKAQTGKADPGPVPGGDKGGPSPDDEAPVTRTEIEAEWDKDAAKDAVDEAIPAMPSLRRNRLAAGDAGTAPSRDTVIIPEPVKAQSSETAGRDEHGCDEDEDAEPRTAPRFGAHKGRSAPRAGFGFGSMPEQSQDAAASQPARSQEADDIFPERKPVTDRAEQPPSLRADSTGPSASGDTSLAPSSDSGRAERRNDVATAGDEDPFASKARSGITASGDGIDPPSFAESRTGQGGNARSLEDRVAERVLAELHGALGNLIAEEIRVLVRREAELARLQAK